MSEYIEAELYGRRSQGSTLKTDLESRKYGLRCQSPVSVPKGANLGLLAQAELVLEV